jgi:valyl-tRNA synthetase
LTRTESEIARFDAKLGNADFVARAPQDVIDEQKEKRAEAEATIKRLREAVGRLGS